LKNPDEIIKYQKSFSGTNFIFSIADRLAQLNRFMLTIVEYSEISSNKTVNFFLEVSEIQTLLDLFLHDKIQEDEWTLYKPSNENIRILCAGVKKGKTKTMCYYRITEGPALNRKPHPDSPTITIYLTFHEFVFSLRKAINYYEENKIKSLLFQYMTKTQSI